MLLDPIIFCHIWMTMQVIAARIGRPVVALQVLNVRPMKVWGRMAITANHLGLTPV
jgi:hypothetical protein